MPIEKQNIGEYGQVVGYRLHDSTVISISYEYEVGRMAMRFRCIDGRVVNLSMHGVGQCGIVALREGAIVNDLFVWMTAEMPTLDVYGFHQAAWEAVFCNEIPAIELKTHVDKVVERSGCEMLMYLECSYGGSIAALCRDVELEFAA